ncbi:MAG: hypothetical protein ACP5MK_03700 [Candidatus Micrarchaeia archaeon]
MGEDKIVKQITSGDNFLYQKAKQIYTNKLTFLREALQNAIDSGSETFEVTIGEKEIVMKDGGAGMSSDFLKRQFGEIGGKTKNNGEIGSFGEGRLSYYMPLVSKDRNENIIYNGHVEIITADGRQKSRFVWNTLSTYEVLEENPTTERGTTIIIKSEKPLDISADEARKYLGKIAVDIDKKIDIEVNGAHVANAYSLGTPAYSGTDAFANKTNGKRSKYSYRCYVNDGSNTLVIAEKGLYVTQIPSAVGGVINFTGPADKTGNSGITTLNREGIILDADEIAFNFMLKAVTKHLLSSNEQDIARKNKRIVDTAYWIATHAPKSYNVKGTVKMLVDGISYGEGTLGELEKVHRIVWSPHDPDEALYKIAAKKGYFIAFLEYENYDDSTRARFSRLMDYLNVTQIQKIWAVEREARRSRDGKTGIEEKLKRYVSAMLMAATQENVREQLLRKTISKVGGAMKKGAGYTATGLIIVGTGVFAVVAGAAKLAMLGEKKASEKLHEYGYDLHERINMIKLYYRFNRAKFNPATDAKHDTALENKQQNGGLKMVASAVSGFVAAGKFAVEMLWMGGQLPSKSEQKASNYATVEQKGQVKLMPNPQDANKENKIDLRYYMMMKVIAEGQLKKQIIKEERQRIKQNKIAQKQKLAEQRWQKMRSNILGMPRRFQSELYNWSVEQAVKSADEAIKKEIVRSAAKEVKSRFRLEEMEKKRKIAEEKAKLRMQKREQAHTQYSEKELESGKLFSNVLGNIKRHALRNSEVLADINGIKIIKAQLGDWETDARHGRGSIVLNTNSRFVSEALEKGRVDLLLPKIVEQYLEGLGVNKNDMPDKALKIIESTNKRLAGNEILLHGNVKDANGKPVIPEIKLSKEEMAKLGGRTVEVIVTPDGEADPFAYKRAEAGAMRSPRQNGNKTSSGTYSPLEFLLLKREEDNVKSREEMQKKLRSI